MRAFFVPGQTVASLLAERMDGVQKNKECQKALFELFSHCCKGPSGEESGECRQAKSPNGEAGECRQAKSPKRRSWGMPGLNPPKVEVRLHPLAHENRSRTKTLLCGPQSILPAPSPWWQYTFAHQNPSTHTQNQHQPRHRFWRDNPRCNLSAIGLRDRIAAKPGNAGGSIPNGEARGMPGGSIPLTHENRSRRDWQTQTPPGVKIVRAPKHYSAAYRVSLLRHPPIGNTRSRTKPQTHTPKINTNCAIDFN